MNKALIIAVATTSFIVMTATDAFAWERHGTVTGSGGYSRSVTGSGSCSGGSCNNSRQVTGPGGYSRTRQGQVSSNPDGGWTRNGTITRRNGNQVNYEGSGSCSGGNCTYGGSRTGPYGTTTHSGGISR